MHITPFSETSALNRTLVSLLFCGSKRAADIDLLVEVANTVFLNAFRGFHQIENEIIRIQASNHYDNVYPLWDGFKSPAEIRDFRITRELLTAKNPELEIDMHHAIKQNHEHLLNACNSIAHENPNRPINRKLLIFSDRQVQLSSKPKRSTREISPISPPISSSRTSLCYFYDLDNSVDNNTIPLSHIGFDELLFIDRNTTSSERICKELRHNIQPLSFRIEGTDRTTL
jgi:hypothetical protein